MGLGAAALLLAAGAILTSVVDVDLPYVDDDALGSLLLVAGVVLLVVGLVVRAVRARDRISNAGAGLAMFTTGAVLIFALEVDVPFVWDSALGVILMVGGAVAMVASVALHRQQQQTRRRTVVHQVR